MTSKHTLAKLPKDLVIMNCAGCGRLLRALRQPPSVLKAIKKSARMPAEIYTRAHGRPFCRDCASSPMANARAVALAGDGFEHKTFGIECDTVNSFSTFNHGSSRQIVRGNDHDYHGGGYNG